MIRVVLDGLPVVEGHAKKVVLVLVLVETAEVVLVLREILVLLVSGFKIQAEAEAEVITL